MFHVRAGHLHIEYYQQAKSKPFLVALCKTIIQYEGVLGVLFGEGKFHESLFKDRTAARTHEQLLSKLLIIIHNITSLTVIK